jgi:iron complex transport system substrate-binding protein
MMNKELFRRMAASLALAGAFALAGAAQGAQAAPGKVAAGTGVSATDSSGRVVTLAAPARRIVSISPAATEVAYAAGAGGCVVGDTTYCDYPAAAVALPKVGGFSSSTISVERIVALKPDLVLTAGPKMHGAVETALAKLGIAVFAYDPVDFDGIARGMNAIGDLAGSGETARAASGAMLSSIAKIRAAVASVPQDRRPTVFWEVYDEPLMTCGAASFPHAVIEAAGGRDIFTDLPGAWPRVSAEEVIRRAPDYIMGADDHGDKLTVAGVMARPGWSTIPALKSGHIVLLPANLVSRAGPRIAEGVLALAKALYPELFR